MKQTNKTEIYLKAFIATAIMLLIYFFLNHQLNGSYWSGMQVSRSATTVEYCEWNNPSAFFHQCMNTYSNLAYFLLGSMIILLSFSDSKEKDTPENQLQGEPILSLFLGGCFIYLCFGSSFFHASLTWVGQRADMNGAYSIALALLAISVDRLLINNSIYLAYRRLLIPILCVIIIAFIPLHLIISSYILLPSLTLCIALATCLTYLKNNNVFNGSYALLSLTFLAIAFFLRWLDVKKIYCNPTSILQLHALWHILTGISAYLLYWFYRSERA